VSLVPPCGPEVPPVEPTFGTVDIRASTIAVDLLRAVADGREEVAGRLADALAERVLATPAVRAALLVREGGPLVIARAVGLAERVLDGLAAEKRPVRPAGQERA
jgi:hypothetical protein